VGFLDKEINTVTKEFNVGTVINRSPIQTLVGAIAKVDEKVFYGATVSAD
jgi:hypothetical protein